MSVFNIKLKTKNGNDVKKKVTFTVYFQLKFTKELKTTGLYTYRIYYKNGYRDNESVFEVKESANIKSFEDLTIKVMINLLHIVASISKNEDLNPDVISFISTDFHSFNLSWRVLKNLFKRQVYTEQDVVSSHMDIDVVEVLEKFVEINPNTSFYYNDPTRDYDRYEKSIDLCAMLSRRIRDLYKKET